MHYIGQHDHILHKFSMGLGECAMQRSEGFQPSRTILQLSDDQFPSDILELAAQFHLTQFERNVIMLCWLAQESVLSLVHFGLLNSDPFDSSPEPPEHLKIPTTKSMLIALSDLHFRDQDTLRPTGKLFECGLLTIHTHHQCYQRLALTPRVSDWLTSAQAQAGAPKHWHDIEPLLRRAYRVLPASSLTPSQQRLLDRMRLCWSKPSRVLHLHGEDASARRVVFAQLCDEQDLSLQAVPLSLEDFSTFYEDILSEHPKRYATREWAQVLNRESVLCQTAFLLELDTDHEVLARRVSEVLERTQATMFVSSLHLLEVRPAIEKRSLLSFELSLRSPEDRVALWRQAFEEAASEIDHQDTVNWDGFEPAFSSAKLSALQLDAVAMRQTAVTVLSEFAALHDGLLGLIDDTKARDQFVGLLLEVAQTTVSGTQRRGRSGFVTRAELEEILRGVFGFDSKDINETTSLN
jgi:hypothetical protein